MGKKKVSRGVAIISVIVVVAFIAGLGVIINGISKRKRHYTVLFLDEYGHELQKAYTVMRPLKWTEADEYKTEEYKAAFIINKRVGPTRIELMLTYGELFTNPWIYFGVIIVLVAIYVFKNIHKPEPKKSDEILVKIVVSGAAAAPPLGGQTVRQDKGVMYSRWESCMVKSNQQPLASLGLLRAT